MAPVIWDAVRFAVDRRNLMSQFILTGSVTPNDINFRLSDLPLSEMTEIIHEAILHDGKIPYTIKKQRK